MLGRHIMEMACMFSGIRKCFKRMHLSTTPRFFNNNSYTGITRRFKIFLMQNLTLKVYADD